MEPDSALEGRIERLQNELYEECKLRVDREALEELAYCRFVEPHEGRRPSYGAVIWPLIDQSAAGRSVSDLPSLTTFVDDRLPLSVLRRFADGRTAFVVRRPGAAPALFVDAAWSGTELSLAAYVERTGVTIVKREQSGHVRIFHRQYIYTEKDGTWLVRPTARAYHSAVAVHVSAEHHLTALRLLNLCVHELSPAGVGATLVWFPTGAGPATRGLGFANAFAPPALSAVDEAHAPALVHALSQLDRAAVVDADGRVLQLNVTLEHGPEQAALRFSGGMRHASAGMFSALQPDAVVFVVSADGPVTVFRRGEVITSTD